MGWPLARRLRGESPQSAVYALLIGIAALAKLALVLLGIGLFSTKILGAVLVLLSLRIAAIRRVFSLAAQLLPSSAGARFFLAFFLIAVIYPASVIPSLESDGRSYHIGNPDIWIGMGSHFRATEWHFTYFPDLVEGLNLYGFISETAVGSFALMAFFLLALAAALLASITPVGPKRDLIWILAYATPAFTMLAIFPKNNIMLGLASIAAVVPWLDSERPAPGWRDSWREILLGGIAFGVALSTQYVAFYFLPVLFFIIASRGSFKSAIGVIAVGFLLASSIYIRNYIETGNPLYPFFEGKKGSEGWSQGFLADTILLVVKPLLSGGFETLGGGSTFGFLLPVGIIGALIVDRSTRGVLAVAAGVLIFATVFRDTNATGSPRYAIGATMITAWCAARFWGGWERGRQWLVPIGVVFALFEIFVMFGSGPRGGGDVGIKTWDVALGRISAEELEARYFPEAPAAKWAANNLPPRSVSTIVLRGIYRWRGRLRPAYMMHEPAIIAAIKKSTDALEAAKFLRAAGITHIAIDEPLWRWFNREYGYFNLTPAEESRYAELIAKSRVIMSDRGFLLAELPQADQAD